MKFFKEKLNKELDKLVPEMSETVRNAKINAARQESKPKRQPQNGGYRKFLPSFMAGLTAVMLAVVGIVSLVGNPTVDKTSFLTVEINPKVSFVSDSNGNVVNLVAENEEADIMLADADFVSSVVGKDLSSAVTAYVDRAARLGYLDVSERGDAVKISSVCKDGRNDAEYVKNSLEEYFRGKGFYSVVVADYVDFNSFTHQNGFGNSSFDEVFEGLKYKNKFFTVRQATEMDVGGWKNFYRENIVYGKIKDYFGGEVSKRLDDIRRHSADINELVELNGVIENHPDNPNDIFKDYWAVKKYSSSVGEGEFKTHMEEMTAKLQAYKSLYGKSVDSVQELNIINARYAIMPVETITSIVSDFTNNLFDAFFEDLSAVLEYVGFDSARIEYLAQTPDDFAEYKNKSIETLGAQANALADKNRQFYEQERLAISKDGYDEFVNGLVSQYGSLEDYWQATQVK